MQKRLNRLFGKQSVGDGAVSDSSVSDEQNILDSGLRSRLLADTNHSTPVAGMRTIWGLLSSYWKSEEKKKAYFYAAVITGLTLLDVYCGVKIAELSKDILNATLDRDAPRAIQEIMTFLGVGTTIVLGNFAENYTGKKLHMNWRGWLSQQFTEAWLSKKAFFHINNIDAIENPDQQIAEYPDKLAGILIGLWQGATHSVMSLTAFTSVLWEMAGTTPVMVMDMMIQVPALSFWVGLGAAAACAAAGTVLAKKTGKPIVDFTNALLNNEGDYRRHLLGIRSNAQGIASYPDQEVERLKAEEELNRIKKNWLGLSFLRAKMAGYNGMIGHLSHLIGMGIGSARYINSSVLTAGTILQYTLVFDKLRHSLSWLMYVTPVFYEIKTLSSRLNHFADRIEAAQNPESFYALYDKDAKIALHLEQRDSIRIQNLVLKGSLSDRLLLTIEDLEIHTGDRVLITGESGSGKSLLVQSLYGLWKHGAGDIALPDDKTIMLAPQVPYVSADSTLRDNVLYPVHKSDAFSDEDIVRVLAMAELEHLVPYLHEKTREGTPWESLSVGEKQRLTFARLFLHCPDIIFLDESTSGLDSNLQEKMYSRLIDLHHNITIVSIAHRSGIADHHTRHLKIQNGELLEDDMTAVHPATIPPPPHTHAPGMQ